MTELHDAIRDQNDEVFKALVLSCNDINAFNYWDYTPLMHSVDVERVDYVNYLIENGAQVNRCAHDGPSALQMATYKGIIEMVKVFLEAGADVNRPKSGYYESPILIACSSWNINSDIVKLLIEYGANVNRENEDGEPPLLKATERRNKEAVKALLNAGANVNHSGRSEKETALHIACSNETKSIEIAKLLIEKRADIHLRNSDGSTPFLEAAKTKDLELVKLLIESGSNIDAVDCNGYSAIDSAVSTASKEIFDYLVEKGANIDIKNNDSQYTFYILTWSLQNENFDILKKLLSKGININSLHPQLKQAPIHSVAEGTSLEVLRILVENGADLNVADADGKTALHYAVSKFHTENIKFLVKNGASINSRDTDEQTPFHYAASAGHLEIISLFCEAGIDINLKGIHERSALHLVCWNDAELMDVFEYLISKGADIKSRDDMGLSLLQIAANNGHVNIVKLLIEKGIDVNDKSEFGVTPLHTATSRLRYEVIDILLERGADLEQKNCFGNTALYYLSECAYTSIEPFKFLLSKGASLNTANNNLQTPLHQTVLRVCSNDVLKFLLENGANPNIQDSLGKYPIHYAATNNNDYAIKLLVKHGSLVNVLSNEEIDRELYEWYYVNKPQTPLQLAVDTGNYKTITALLDARADVNQRSKHGNTALHYASDMGDDKAQIAEILVAKGAELNAVNENEETPLHQIAKLGNEHTVKYLIEMGANVNAVNKEAGTPLHETMYGFHYNPAVKVLVNMGADINAVDKEGQTLLKLALKKGYESFAELLTEKGAKVDI